MPMLRRSGETGGAQGPSRPALAQAAALYLVNFAGAKGITFFGFPALGLVLSAQTYGALEFSLAVAGIAGLVLTLGSPAAAMQIMLMRSDRRIVDLLAAVVVLCATLALVAAGALHAAGARLSFEIAAAMTAVYGLQVAALSYARASSWRIANLWIEHIPSLLTMTIAVLLVVAGRPDDLGAYSTSLTASAIAIACGAALVFARTCGPDGLRRMKEAVRVGAPIVAVTLGSVWIMSSARIWYQLFGDEDSLFAYAFSFRLATLPAIVATIVIGAFSAELYKMPTRRFDRIGALLTAALFLGSLAYMIAGPEVWIASRLAPAKARILVDHPLIVLAPAQVFFYASQPFLNMRVARARLALRATSATLAVVGLSMALIAALHAVGRLTPLTIAIVAVAQQAAALAASHVVLARRGVPLRRTATASVVGGLALVLAAGLIGLRTPLANP